MPEKCALSHGSGVLGRDPRDSCRFWSPDVENVCTVTQIRLGEGGGGGDTMGGGSANREPGSYIRLRVGMAWDVHAGSQYGFVWAWHAGSQTQANMVDVINYLRHAPELRLPRCWPEDW